jgi:DNA-binding response OmpR family regulator
MAKKINILIAEDEHPISASMKFMLESSGFTATVANNGREAMDNMKKDKYDLLLLDLMMPELDGFGVLEEMKVEKITIPVIISSNLGQGEDLEKAKKYGVKDYFVKSDTSLVEVIEHIKKVLKKKF